MTNQPSMEPVGGPDIATQTVPPALEARSVVKTFGTVRALRGVSFEAFPGR